MTKEKYDCSDKSSFIYQKKQLNVKKSVKILKKFLRLKKEDGRIRGGRRDYVSRL